MAERLGEALLDLDTNDRKFNQGIDRAQGKATNFGRSLDDLSRRAAMVGRTLSVAAGAGVGLFAVGIASAVKRLEELRKASAQVDRALKNSGNTARTSAKEIEAWADALELRTGRAAEEVMAISANLASFGFGREQFYRAIALADDMAAAWGGDLKQNLEGLSRALDDPINGMAMLSKRGVKLTDEQRELAKSFLDAGDKAAAQGVVFDALEAQVKGVAEAGFGGLTKAMTLAQKAWEDAFEDLVKGDGKASGLNATLNELMATVSSPEFISGVMGFGQAVITVIDAIAKMAVGAFNAFNAFLELVNRPDGPVDRWNWAMMPLEQRDTPRLRDDLARREGWIANGANVDRDNVVREIEEIRAILDARPADWGTFDPVGDGASFDDLLSSFVTPGSPVLNDPDFDPYAGLGTGASDASKKVEALIADLEHERRIVGLSALDQEVMNAVRRVGVGLMSDEGLTIRRLITETAEHRDQLEQMEEVYGLLGDVGKTAIMGLVDAMKDGQVEGNELLSILGNVLNMAGNFFLNAAFSGGGGMGGGGLGSLFSGFFADGGLIPTGSFGIVGEEGPEPVIGTPHGAQVLPNSSLADMLGGGGSVNNITINGSGLSQAEMTQAIADALNHFDRFHLPGRVAAINADPLARG